MSCSERGIYIPDGVRETGCMICLTRGKLALIVLYHLVSQEFPSTGCSGVLPSLHGFFVLGHVESYSVPQHDCLDFDCDVAMRSFSVKIFVLDIADDVHPGAVLED